MQVVAMESGLATAYHPETGREQIVFPREINTMSHCESSWKYSIFMQPATGLIRESTSLQTQL